MIYPDGSSFRRALEDRLRSTSLSSGVPLLRLRKLVAFDRFLSRLQAKFPEKWLLKGGFALQLRLGNKARTTKDIDLLLLSPNSEAHVLLRSACNVDLHDWFSFEVGFSNSRSQVDFNAFRFHVVSYLDSRTFEEFHLDVGFYDQVMEKPDQIALPDLLEFAGINSVKISCYSLAQQLAEKYHAYTGNYQSGENSRVKDLVDILLIASWSEFKANKLRKVFKKTFQNRATHQLTAAFPPPPSNWDRPFKRLAIETGLSYTDLKEAELAASNFFVPLFAGDTNATWSPLKWKWE